MPDDEEQKTNQPTGGQGPVSPTGAGGGAVHLAPSSSVPTVGGGGTSGPTGSGPAAAGGSFASLNKYMAANQGQAEPLAEKLTSAIGQQYNTLSGQTDSTLNDINNQIAANAAPTNPDSVVAQESANPVSFASDPGNVKSFQNLLNASYSGPASAEGLNSFSNQQNAINNAISTGTTNTATEAGRENLLTQNEAAPTTGVTALNSAILSQSPTALGSVENAYKPFNNLLTTMQTGAATADKNIASRQTQVAADNKAANDAISNQTQGLNTAVNNQLGAANTTNSNFVNEYNDLVDSFGSTAGLGKITPQQLSDLGLTQAQLNDLGHQSTLANTSQYMTGHNFGAASPTSDINQDAYLNQLSAPADVTANQVATPQQFSTLLALLNLNNGQLPTGAVLDPTAISQAGSYIAPTLNGAFNYDQALQNATTTQQQERAAAQAQADALTAQADAAHAASKKSGIANTIKNTISNPVGAMSLNPQNFMQTLQNALKGKDPNGNNPLPTAAELHKIGAK